MFGAFNYNTLPLMAARGKLNGRGVLRTLGVGSYGYQKKTKLFVAIYNCRTLSNQDKLTKLEEKGIAAKTEACKAGIENE